MMQHAYECVLIMESCIVTFLNSCWTNNFIPSDSSELLEFQEHKKSIKVDLDAKKDDQKEMETCFGFDVSFILKFMFLYITDGYVLEYPILKFYSSNTYLE